MRATSPHRDIYTQHDFCCSILPSAEGSTPPPPLSCTSFYHLRNVSKERCFPSQSDLEKVVHAILCSRLLNINLTTWLSPAATVSQQKKESVILNVLVSTSLSLQLLGCTDFANEENVIYTVHIIVLIKVDDDASPQDGVVDPMDSTLRDFCGRCIEEFVSWSIKQTTPKQQEKSPTNMKSLFKRIYSLALHPNGFKRLGAALAFNSIYRQFRCDTFPTVFVWLMIVIESSLFYFFLMMAEVFISNYICPFVIAGRKSLWWISLSLKCSSYSLKVWLLHTQMSDLWVTTLLWSLLTLYRWGFIVNLNVLEGDQ